MVADAAPLPRIHPSVHRALEKQGSADIIVTLKQTPAAAIASVQEADFDSRGAKIEALVGRLEQLATESQSALNAVLAQESAPAAPLYQEKTSFWISNQVFIKGASHELVQRLSALPSLSEVREQLILPLPAPIHQEDTGNSTSTGVLANEWGITKIGAPSVWASGNTGQKVVVSTIDTGVLYTHEALKNNFRSSHGWFDPFKKTTTPTDENGHGTHTMGTIAGSGGIGVAPGAKWIACRGCTTEGCTEADLLSCAQFITCPTDADGKNKDCAFAPHVVSNSWGGGQGDTFYKAAVDTWVAAGIIPVFANGNEGPECGTANSPGDYENVIAVGATDSNDALASFSSKGPAKSGLLKPEVSAPGSSVRSSWNSGPTSYKSISGTSMACPHVSGIVALLLNANPGLKFADVKKILTSTTDTKTLQPAGKTCGSISDDTFPNSSFGYGRVNAQKAVNAAGSSPAPVPTSPTPSTAPTPAPSSAAPPPRPSPAPSTVAPTPAPGACATLGYFECTKSPSCTWDWSSFSCAKKA
uniref:subtilisin n=1 Tax=Globisporangium ultimum (strain ATCC 200006 / CBS 805.95 / DAOM BR144) TaxID=431595 RepID=K3X3V7_GLOUD